MKSITSTLSCFILVLGTLFWPSIGLPIGTSPPKVVVSITPFYALVAYVMQGVGTPKLLVKNGSSPHQYALRPSEMKLLKEANIIFWAGPNLETFLLKPLAGLQAETPVSIVELAATPGLLLLPIRQTPNFDPHQCHDHNHDHPHAEDNHPAMDMHFWLDPKNAIILTEHIVNTLSQIDPKHLNIYQRNAHTLKKRLHALDLQIGKKIAKIKNKPFVVFHDAYQYFEHHFGLNGVGAITLHPEVPPSAKRLAQIRSLIQQSTAHCVFTEPQFQPKLVQSIIQDLNVKTSELDPIGQAKHNNPEGYFQLLDNLSDSLSTCLQ